jgi:prepilin-type N-terminal cleavage/methylation domain-containing protein
MPDGRDTGPNLVSMRRGITLAELLIVILIAGILATMALPGIAALHDRLAVGAAAQAVVAAHVRARMAALAERRTMVLALTADSLVLRAVESPVDSIERWRGDGPAAHGVAVTGLPRLVSFAPSGVTMGFANATYTMTRGGATRSVIVSRYGRVRVQ